MNQIIKVNPTYATLLEAIGPIQDLGELLKFAKGEWTAGDRSVPEGARFIADPLQVARGWVRFHDGAVTDRHVGKLADGYQLPARETLGDLDPAEWEKDATGQPRDPWACQWYLPMMDEAGEEEFTYQTSSRGGEMAISKLISRAAYAPAGMRPIVKLGARSYRHSSYGKIEAPTLAIVGWAGRAVADPADLIDEVPF